MKRVRVGHLFSCCLDRPAHLKRADYAEVVGSNPTRSIFINLVNYGIELRLFWVVVDKTSSNGFSIILT